jgi:hypothetical protein
MRARRSVRLLLSVAVAGCTPIGEPGEPVPTPRPTPTATPSATAVAESVAPAPTSSPSPSPSPTPVPDAPETLELDVTGCPGGVVVDWSPATHPEFHHYTALRSIEAEVNVAYPPIAPAVDWGDSYATDRFVTSAVDATLIPSDTTLYYRVMAYDDVNRPVAATTVKAAHLFDVVELGPLLIEPGDGPDATLLDWTLFGGLGGCFTAYHVLVGPAGTQPVATLTTISQQSTSELETSALHPGQSYALRVEALRTTTLGSFVVAHTETAVYTVP